MKGAGGKIGKSLSRTCGSGGGEQCSVGGVWGGNVRRFAEALPLARTSQRRRVMIECAVVFANPRFLCRLALCLVP